MDIQNWPLWNVWTRVDEENDTTSAGKDASSTPTCRKIRRNRNGRRRRSSRIHEGVSGTMKLKLSSSSPKSKSSKWTKSASFEFTGVSEKGHQISWTTSSPTSPLHHNPFSRAVVTATGGGNMQRRRHVIHIIKLDPIDCTRTVLTHTKEIQGAGNGLLGLGLPTSIQRLVPSVAAHSGLSSSSIFSYDSMHRNCVLMDTELKYHVERLHFCSLVETVSTRSFSITDVGSSISSNTTQSAELFGAPGGSSNLNALNPTTCDPRALNNSAYWDTPKSLRNIIVSSYLQPSEHSSSSEYSLPFSASSSPAVVE